MAINKPYTPDMKWDQSAYEALRATWPPERIAEDERALKEIFKLAEDCPLLAEELEWAKQHGIKFFIDHQAVNLGGYYKQGMGVVVIAENFFEDPANAVEALAHELRHAWQDYHGLVRLDYYNFDKYSIQDALREADAFAFGRLAQSQYLTTTLEKKGAMVAYPAIENERLAALFMHWFSPQNLTGTGQSFTGFYGDASSKRFGQGYGLFPVDNTKPDKGLPVRQKELAVTLYGLGQGINVDNIQDVLRLGVNFSGTANYLAQMQPDILLKKVLRPSLAHTFWGVANAKQKKLTTEIRKSGLRQKLAPENKRKYHPWP